MARTRKTTIEDVALAAGVSMTTVSYVLSGSKYVNEISLETRRRVTEAAASLGYSRDSVAVAFRRGYTNTVLFVVVHWDLTTVASGYAATTTSLCRAAAERGLTVSVHVASGDDEAVEFLKSASSSKPYGLLLLWDSDADEGECLEDLIASGIPVVDIMPSPPTGIASVAADRTQGFRIAAQHLIDLGHRRIGVILDMGRQQKTSRLKLAGYESALENAGIDFDEGLIVDTDCTASYEAGYAGLGRLVGRSPDLTAILAINDYAALGAIAAAQDMGIKVPEQLSVVGYNAEKEGTYFRPTLTTIGVSHAKMAQDAVQLLVNLRSNPEFNAESVSEPMELIVRESTSRARPASKLPRVR